MSTRSTFSVKINDALVYTQYIWSDWYPSNAWQSIVNDLIDSINNWETLQYIFSIQSRSDNVSDESLNDILNDTVFIEYSYLIDIKADLDWNDIQQINSLDFIANAWPLNQPKYTFAQYWLKELSDFDIDLESAHDRFFDDNTIESTKKESDELTSEQILSETITI